MSPRPLTEDDRATALRLQSEGKSGRFIADAIGRNVGYVSYWLMEGCPVRPRSGGKSKAYTQADREAALTMEADGKRDIDVARALGRSVKSIGEWRRRSYVVGAHGGDRRSADAPRARRVPNYYNESSPINSGEEVQDRIAAREASATLIERLTKLTPVAEPAPRRRMTFEEQLAAARAGTMRFVERVEMPSRAATHVYSQANS